MKLATNRSVLVAYSVGLLSLAGCLYVGLVTGRVWPATFAWVVGANIGLAIWRRRR